MPKWLDAYDASKKTFWVKTERERDNCRKSLWAKGIKVSTRKKGNRYIVFKGEAPYGYERYKNRR